MRIKMSTIDEMKILEMKTLVMNLNIAGVAYYTNDQPIMEDPEYDIQYRRLLVLEKETGVVLDNSPTQRIGNVTLAKYTQHTHKAPLWSLDKAHTDEELEVWYLKVVTFVTNYNLSHVDQLPPPKFNTTKKYDGITINSTYDKLGSLTKSASRGNGIIGEYLLEQAKTIINVPHKIDNDFEFEIHGEALMTKKVFEDYNNNLKKDEKPLKTLRNAAAGAFRNLDVNETAKRKIVAYMYDIGFSDGHQFETYTEMLDFIKEKGFPTAEYHVCNNLDEINEQVKILEKQRANLAYDIDGLVIVVDDIKTRKLMGFNVKFPLWAIARKFSSVNGVTTLLKVELNVGRTGVVFPTGITADVNLMGAIVNRVTLNNMDYIEEKHVRIGSLIKICRSGDVVPKLLSVIENGAENTIEIKMPKLCPSCSSPLVKEGPNYYCKNTLSCKPQLVKNIVHFAEKEAMNIVGIAIKTIEKLMEENIVNTVIDLYRLNEKKEEIVKLKRFGDKSFLKMVNSIEKSRCCTFQALIYALGIDGVGEKASTDITKVFNTMEKLKNATTAELIKIKDVGGITANGLIKWFNSDKNIKLLEELLEYVIIKKEEVKEIKEGIFTGKTIYCTGTFESYKKSQLKTIVENLGGDFAKGYNKSLSMLVVGKIQGSTKVTQAENDGVVKIVTEDEFLEMIQS